MTFTTVKITKEPFKIEKVDMFKIIESNQKKPLRVVLVGGGAMGREWVKTISKNHSVTLVGVADMNILAAHSAADEYRETRVSSGTNFLELAQENDAQCIINVTSPGAHQAVSQSALLNGFSVLSEKPVAENVQQTLSLLAAAESSQNLLMISQSRRWNPQLFEFRNMVETIDPSGILNCSFFKGPRFGGFRDQMDSPLLIDMAIHMFDSARFILASDARSVFCQSYNPKWSWYKGDAAASAIFSMYKGSTFNFNGSWCSDQNETSWDSNWQYFGADGAATWDGETRPSIFSKTKSVARFEIMSSGIDHSLEIYRTSLNNGTVPMGEVHENIGSLAMVEGALLSASRGSVVEISEVYSIAKAQALVSEPNKELCSIIERFDEHNSSAVLTVEGTS